MTTMNFLKQLTFNQLFRYLDYCICLYILYFTILVLIGVFFASVDECFSFGSSGFGECMLPHKNNKFAFALCLLNNNKLSFNNYLRSFLHSSAILKSDPLNPLPVSSDDSGPSNPLPVTLDESGPSNPRSPILEAVARLERERLSSLQLEKYQKKPAEELESD